MDRCRPTRRHVYRHRGNNQSSSAGTALSTPLTVTLTPPLEHIYGRRASVLFTTSSGTLSNGTTSGSSVIATTNASGVASVTLTLPSTTGTVTVTAQDQFALAELQSPSLKPRNNP